MSPRTASRLQEFAKIGIPWIATIVIAWFALTSRVTVAETRQEELRKLPAKMEAVEGRVSSVESRLSATEANQRQILEMLREMRGDIKELIREEK